ncbi:MAG: hypothetical protein D5R97_00625 [Candidatus Syntrophonatronum acetioxidans]|uniref:Methylene-tetrahydrofolate reductase C-terminal-like domain-containing protein n=1 Tax=Candidatus Syntrophonatronum acetioxidans TaxID=1795816 RepID=A0A424YIR4_9FIRM|nr:MAG: hypothetical protein D5R97_00625 [Candidatus Syntrophonatronum acetioxidans]
MIIGERKPLEEVFSETASFNKILVLGCETCVAVCLAGGRKEAEETAEAISLHRKKENKPVEVKAESIQRQCEYEFIEEIQDLMKEYDVVLSLACGVGVQTMTYKCPDTITLPGLNTKFMGYPLEQGVWLENCQGCGDCVLDITAGICPITRCSKSILNGPCGGSSEGLCEISTKEKEIECGWHLIYERLKELGKADNMMKLQPYKNWSVAFDGGPGKIVREDVKIVQGE